MSTYEELDITIMITVGKRCAFALNSNNDLLVMHQTPSETTSVNLGPLNQARAKELGEYLQRLAPKR